MIDPIEAHVAQTLDMVNVKYIIDGDEGNKDTHLDFYLPDYDTYIEVKAAHTPRISEQMGRAKNIIVLQSIVAAQAFRNIIQQHEVKK